MTLHTYDAPYAEINPDGNPAFLLVCDHASNAVPDSYKNLGLPEATLTSHRGWDIGAAAVTGLIAQKLQCPAIFGGFSRLLIDPNRGLDDPTLIMQLSDGEIIPGNRAVLPGQKCDAWRERVATYHTPYHERISAQVTRAEKAGVVPIILSVHSFTPIWKGVKRPMPAAVLWDKDDRLRKHLKDALASRPVNDDRFSGPIGDNQPYSGRLKNDTLYTHGTSKGLPHAMIELRQDLLTTVADQTYWADVMVAALSTARRDESCAVRSYFGSFCV